MGICCFSSVPARVVERPPPPTQFALRGQQAIRRCRAHGKQVFSALLCDLEVLMPFQGLNERGEKGNEAFGAHAVGGVPDQEERVLDFWPILWRTRASKRLLHLLCMVEQPPGVGTMVSSDCHKGIQQRPFL